MNKEAYAEYLLSPHWIAFKRRYRASRRPQACVVCGSRRVELHHCTYQRIGRERLKDVVPLCARHHEEAHRIRNARRSPKPTATVRQFVQIRRLGGVPPAEMTMRQAKRLIRRLQKEQRA